MAVAQERLGATKERMPEIEASDHADGALTRWGDPQPAIPSRNSDCRIRQGLVAEGNPVFLGLFDFVN